MTPLLYACKGDFFKIVELLLEKDNIDINAQDNVSIFIFYFVFFF